MQKAYLYIGSNNETHELEIGKAEDIISRHFDGFTAYEVVGYWKGRKERTLKVEIVTEAEPSTLARVAKELKTALNQESVLLEIVQSNFAFIQ